MDYAGSGSYVTGSGCSHLGPPDSDKVDGSGSSEEPGYPTLPGSLSFGPSGPKEWAFQREYTGIHGNTRNTRLPWFPGSRVPGSRVPRDPSMLYLWSSLIAFGRKEAGFGLRRSRLLAGRKPAFGLKKPAFGLKEAGFWPEEAGFWP